MRKEFKKMKKTTYLKMCKSIQRIALKNKRVSTKKRINSLDNEILKIYKDYENETRIIETYFNNQLHGVTILYGNESHAVGYYKNFDNWFRV